MGEGRGLRVASINGIRFCDLAWEFHVTVQLKSKGRKKAAQRNRTTSILLSPFKKRNGGFSRA
jgi:hypothetical protein